MSRQQTRVAVSLIVHLIVTFITWRDLTWRAPSEVRGPKWVWRLASGANTLGSVTYWLVGRRPGATEVAV